MSQTSHPYGLSRFEYKGGKNRESVSVYPLASGYATSLGQGDPVNLSPSGGGGLVVAYSAPTGGAPASSTQTLGTFVNVTYTNAQGQEIISPYWPANTVTYGANPAVVTIADLPYNIYQVQCNGSLALTGNQTAIGKNYNLIITGNNGPNASTGQSRAALDVNSGIAGANNINLTAKIIGLAPVPINGTNAWTDPYPDVLIIINNHVFKTGTLGNN